MNPVNIDFTCDTEDCIYWAEGVCCKGTSVTIQAHHCMDYEKKEPKYQYHLIAGIPPLLSEVFVTISECIYYKARFLGYGLYGKHDYGKTYCVEVIHEDGRRHVDFFNDIYSRKLEEDTE